MIARKINPNAFKPFKIEISINSEADAKALYAVFNLTHNVALLGETSAHSIKTAIGNEYYVNQLDDLIANGMKYTDFYKHF